jgi:hypothetical protein
MREYDLATRLAEFRHEGCGYIPQHRRPDYPGGIRGFPSRNYLRFGVLSLLLSMFLLVALGEALHAQVLTRLQIVQIRPTSQVLVNC